MAQQVRNQLIPARSTLWDTLWRRPHSLKVRKLLFQVHLWVGIGAGVYVLVVATSGAALVFRSEIQHAAHPEFFPAPHTSEGGRSHIADVAENMAATYPGHLLVGVGVPNERQHTFVGYIFKDEQFRAVFAEPATGRVIGALPEDAFLEWLQNLHFYLLAGRNGLLVNGIGGLLLFVLCVTGLALWWPGVASWRRNLKVDLTANPKRINRDLHHTVGFCAAAFLALWSITGAYFSFPQQYRNVVGWFSEVHRAPIPTSNASGKGGARVDLRTLVAAAGENLPDSQVARVSLPRNDSETVQLVMTRSAPSIRENADYVYLYFDQFTGELLHRRDLADRTWGDRLMPWFGRLHVGAFGGVGVKLVWFFVGFAPAALFVTGLVMWWSRVITSRLEDV